MSPEHPSHHHQPSFDSLQAPCRIDHFARFEERLSHAAFIDTVRDDSTALILGNRSPQQLANNLTKYVFNSDISFYRVIDVSPESVAKKVTTLFSELNFNPPLPRLSNLLMI
jgi:hypothetical protein